MKFKLLAGKHIARDYNAEPVPILDAGGKQAVDTRTGKPLVKYPSKTYNVGDTVEEPDIDLVERFGHEKFAYVGDRPQKAMGTSKGSNKPGDAAPLAFQVAPAGQVIEGHQQTTSLPDGRQVSGAADEKAMQLNEEARQEHEQMKAQKLHSQEGEQRHAKDAPTPAPHAPAGRKGAHGK